MERAAAEVGNSVEALLRRGRVTSLSGNGRRVSARDCWLTHRDKERDDPQPVVEATATLLASRPGRREGIRGRGESRVFSSTGTEHRRSLVQAWPTSKTPPIFAQRSDSLFIFYFTSLPHFSNELPCLVVLCSLRQFFSLSPISCPVQVAKCFKHGVTLSSTHTDSYFNFQRLTLPFLQ